MKSLAIICLIITSATSWCATEFDLAATATNQFAVDLHRQLATGDGNLCVSPYSIQNALAMAFAGADGETRNEMARVLHLPKDNDVIHASFAALHRSLDEMTAKTVKIATEGGPNKPITISIANRLFAQSGYDFRDSFRALVKKFYGAPFELLDFRNNPDRERAHINKWVEKQTRDRIRDLIPVNGITRKTRLVLANAIYLKAPWDSEFSETATQPKPFHVRGSAAVNVPTMNQQTSFDLAKRGGYTAVALPYSGSELQFLILLPNEANGLHRLERKLTAEMLMNCAKLEAHDVDLSLPKFKFEPPTVSLKAVLKRLGTKTAFDDPLGSANFDRMALRKPDDYLAMSDAFHKTFIAVDEKGTEAAAATLAVTTYATGMPEARPKPIIVKVDHPFLYAIQHVPSGACLFLGRVTDPR